MRTVDAPPLPSYPEYEQLWAEARRLLIDVGFVPDLVLWVGTCVRERGEDWATAVLGREYAAHAVTAQDMYLLLVADEQAIYPPMPQHITATQHQILAAALVQVGLGRVALHQVHQWILWPANHDWPDGWSDQTVAAFRAAQTGGLLICGDDGSWGVARLTDFGMDVLEKIHPCGFRRVVMSTPWLVQQ